jgi:hypothetical protein
MCYMHVNDGCVYVCVREKESPREREEERERFVTCLRVSENVTRTNTQNTQRYLLHMPGDKYCQR